MSPESSALLNRALQDRERLAVLDAYDIMDTVPEEGFEDLAQLTALACATPVALVSLVARDRQWFKARVGFPSCETDLDRSVCKFALAEPDLLVIPDLTADSRTAANPLVTGEPRIRFYAGAPLRSPEGHTVGSLCVIDTKPRPNGLTATQAGHLRRCARQAMSLLELRRATVEKAVAVGSRDAALRREGHLAILAEASAALLTASDPSRVIEPILETSTHSLGFEQCFIYDLAPGGRSVRLTGSIGVDEAMRAALADIDLDKPLCGIVVQTGQPLVLAHVQDGPEPRYAMARESGVDAYAGYPIRSRGRLSGVISFGSSTQGAFDEDTLTFFATIARYLSAVRERLDGEAALRASEMRSRLAQEAARIGTYEADIASGLMTVSPEFCRLFGLPVSPLLSVDAATDRIVPEDAHLASTQASREAGTTPPQATYRIRRADDGAVRWVTRTASFVHDSEGRPVRMLGTVQDVTEIQETLRLLGENQERLRAADQRLQVALVASGVVGLWDWMVDTDLLHGDANFARLYGLDAGRTEAGLTMEQYQEFVVPEDLEPLRARIRDTFEHGADFHVEYRLAIPGHDLRWVECKGQLIHDPDGQPVRFSGTAVDITERKTAEARLAASEAHWRGLFERLSEGFIVGEVIRDEAGAVRDWRYVEVNRAWGELVSIDPARAVGRTIREMFPGIEDAWVHEFADVVETGRPVSFIRQVGALARWYEGRAFPLGSERFGVIFLEVTERVQADARREGLLEFGDRMRTDADAAEVVKAGAATIGRVLGVGRVGYGTVGPDGETLVVGDGWSAQGFPALAERHRLDDYGLYAEDLRQGRTVVIPDVREDPRTKATAAALDAVSVRALINLPIVEKGRMVAILFVNDDRPREWAGPEVAFVRQIAELIRQAVERRHAEARQDLLNHELSHRLKNTLAMVTSIANQTLRSLSDRGPVETLQRRIQALASAHDLLLRRNWSPAPLHAVCEGVVNNAADAGRITLDGPDVALGPAAAMSASLLLHELATNAAKYGALSNDAGHVDLRWSVEDGADGPDLVMRWQERGGPPVVAPTSRGFGSRLIRTGLVGTGGVDTAYNPDGVVTVMRAPMVEVQRT
ncbi:MULTISPECIES: GAF domain-containing protein [Methylobacterium]|nr:MULTISPECIES: GAF domain-containing protein [Methylobacterium]